MKAVKKAYPEGTFLCITFDLFDSQGSVVAISDYLRSDLPSSVSRRLGGVCGLLTNLAFLNLLPQSFSRSI